MGLEVGKEGRTRHVIGDRHNRDGHSYERPSEVARDVRRDIRDAVEVGYLPMNLKYDVRSSGSHMGGDAVVMVEASGLSDADRFEPGEVDRHGMRVERSGVRELRSRLNDVAGRYGAIRENLDTEDIHVTYWPVAMVRSETSAG